MGGLHRAGRGAARLHVCGDVSSMVIAVGLILALLGFAVLTGRGGRFFDFGALPYRFRRLLGAIIVVAGLFLVSTGVSA